MGQRRHASDIGIFASSGIYPVQALFPYAGSIFAPKRREHQKYQSLGETLGLPSRCGCRVGTPYREDSLGVPIARGFLYPSNSAKIRWDVARGNASRHTCS
jgi:hypothetical protein